MNRTLKTFVFWLVIVIAGALLWQTVRADNTPAIPEISYSRFLSEVEAGSVAKVSIFNREVTGDRHDGTRFRVIAPNSQEGMLETLRKANVEIWFRDSGGNWVAWLMNLAPLLLLCALWYVMIRQIRGRAAKAGDVRATGTVSGG